MELISICYLYTIIQCSFNQQMSSVSCRPDVIIAMATAVVMSTIMITMRRDISHAGNHVPSVMGGVDRGWYQARRSLRRD